MRHDPTFSATGRLGCWAMCSCGWRSATWTAVTGAHLNFGGHLAATTTATPATAHDERTAP